MEEPEDQVEHIVFPAEAIKHLPEEWQEYLYSLKEEGQGVLDTADENLRNLNRLIHAFPAMTSLRYIHHRLSSTKFEATMEWVLENDLLTLAFVTTYARLVEGGIGSGVSRSALPLELRSVHDNIIELRNKRYAHNAGHDSVTGSMEVGFDGEKFEIGVGFNVKFHVGGAREWKPLVEFLDNLMFERLHTHLEKLKARTGRVWSFPSGPPPTWGSSESDSSALGGEPDSSMTP